MRICYARKGFQVRVFDNGDLKTDDDYSLVLAKTNMEGCVTIRTFESSATYNNEYGDEVEVMRETKSNLDGKISSMVIYFEGI